LPSTDDIPGVLIYQAAVLNAAITPQSPFPGIANVIQTRFTFDIHMVPGTIITLAGFKSMQVRAWWQFDWQICENVCGRTMTN
jgi:hypothetical protein